MSEQVTLEEWQQVVSDGLAQEASYVWFADGEVEAYVLCYEGATSTQVEIGYIGGRNLDLLDAYLPFYTQVANELFARYEVVEIEADDVDPYAYAFLKRFEYDKSDSWDTYILG